MSQSGYYFCGICREPYSLYSMALNCCARAYHPRAESENRLERARQSSLRRNAYMFAAGRDSLHILTEVEEQVEYRLMCPARQYRGAPSEFHPCTCGDCE